MQLAQLIFQNLFSFIAIITIIVFIHEFGHFYIARRCGVKVDEFAIGFGKKLFGFKDKHGTQWKFCLWPFGGYVKMHGDKNGASMPDEKAIAKMSKKERAISFIGKNVYQRMAIVLAGPIANFILAIFIFTILFKINGFNQVLPVINEVMPKSAAFKSGLKVGDKILSIDGDKINNFAEIKEHVISLSSDELLFKIERKSKILEFKITPRIQVRKDFFGDEVKLKTLGIASGAKNIIHQDLSITQSFAKANGETYRIGVAIFKALGELITGKRSVKELGGPVKIAKYSGKTAEMGLTAVLWFMAMISINLGVMNLLPVPVLDGGHFFYYVIEAIRGKALSQKTQQFGYRIGLSLVLSLMVFATVNDVVQLFIK